MSNEDFDLETETEAETDAPERNRPIVYVRSIAKEDVPEAQESAHAGPFYALHDAEGRPIALFTNRDAAFLAARTNDLQAVSAH